MQRSFPIVLTVSALAITTSLSGWSQGAPAPTAARPPARPTTGDSLTAERAEKAQDEALLQQLEADSKEAEVQARADRKGRAGTKGFPGGGAVVSPDAAPFVFGGQTRLVTRPSSSRALVVRTGQADAKAQSGLEEDLAVMSHLLDKALEDVPGAQRKENRAMGIDVFFSPGASPVRSLYVDGYGALFFLKVGFPLLAPAEKHVEEKVNGDSAWEEARQELYGQHQGPNEAGEEFNHEKVDKLKETLFETLKNASNIRGLKAEDFVTICVSGGTSSGGRVRKIRTNSPNAGGNIELTTASESAASRSFLTLRARKSDIDHFAKGQLTLADFQKQSQLTTYGADAPSMAMESTMVNSYNARAK